jgi:glutaredoxin
VKEFLNFIDVEYEEVNIEENEAAKNKLEELKNNAEAPVLAVGKNVVEGFDRELIIEALENNDIEVDQAPIPR